MNMCPTNKCKPPPELCLKGQVFFIYTNTQSLESVKDRISLLGGKVDPFLSRDVTTVLVEDNHLVGPQLLSPDLTVKAAYAPNGAVVTTFPYPNSLCNIPSTSRGYNFIAATNSSNSPYRIICYARQWGIKVLGIYQFLTWIEPQVKTATRQKKKATENVSLLTGYYIKFESLQKNYRPCYKMFTNDPNFLLPLKNANLLVKPATCNVILEKPIGPRQLHISHMEKADRPAHPAKGANFAVKPNERKPQNNKIKPKEESNYCECCRTHFSDLKQHIRSSRHQSFVSNEKNYESVHNILKMLPTPQEFIEKLQNPSPSSDLPVANGDISLCISSANMPETDYAMPLNFQMKRETVPTFMMPLDLHVEKNVSHVSPNLTLVKEEPLPLDLHVRRDYEVNVESKDKQETSIGISHGPGNSLKKAEANTIEPKIETQNNTFKNMEEDKQLVQTHEEMQCDELNGDSLLDRTNTAALAQLCLKNFDSYWLDTIPCEMDDMVFDDIFDFDEGKSKVDNECPEPFVENFVAPVNDQISDISNPSPNLKTQANETITNHSNNTIDLKDKILPEAHNTQSIPSSSKIEKDFKRSVSPQNAHASCQEPYIGEKKQIFSIAAYCANKTNTEASPPYTNTNPGKNAEILFSSESSDDDENGNVLISNALHFITNSDNEVRGERDIDENSFDEPPKQYFSVKKVCNNEVKTEEMFLNIASSENVQGKIDVQRNLPLMSSRSHDSGKIDVQRNSVLINSKNDLSKIDVQKNSPLINSRSHDSGKIDVQKNSPLINSRSQDSGKVDVQKNSPLINSRSHDSSKIDVPRNSVLINSKSHDPSKIEHQRSSVLVNTKNPALVQTPSVHEVKMDIDHCTIYNEKQPIIKDDMKKKTENFENISKGKDCISNEIKIDSTLSKQCSVSPRKCSYSDISSEMQFETAVPSKRIRADEIKMKESDLIKDKESLSSKIKCDPENYEADKMKPIDMSSKKKCNNSSFIGNGMSEVKEVKVSFEKKPVAINNVIAKEREDPDFKERYLIPKKKLSFYGMKSELGSSVRHNTPTVNTVPYENKVDQNRYFTPVKGEKDTEMMKNQPMPVENCLISKTDIKKDVTQTVKEFSPSPCQYSSRVEKYKAKVSANALPVQSTVKEKTIKIPQKQKSSKLRELPPLWSVSILPGSGVKLKFTCLQTKEKNNLQSDCRE